MSPPAATPTATATADAEPRRGWVVVWACFAALAVIFGVSYSFAAFFDWLFSLSWVGATPNREAIDSMGRYFSWADNRGAWGATPGTAATSAAAVATRFTSAPPARASFAGGARRRARPRGSQTACAPRARS